MASFAAEIFDSSEEKLGLELEMPVADRQGRSHSVGPFFSALRDIKQRRGTEAVLKSQAGREIGVIAPLMYSSIDNAFNNLETAIGPVGGGPGGLDRLNVLVNQELADVSDALAAEGATILNFSEHPNVAIDPLYYTFVRAPKPIYDYWVLKRGWNHSVGVDAKAQNGPTTAVDFANAVSALNVSLALAPAFIALFANSPFEAGRLTGLKENRLTIWPRMFATSFFNGDRKLHVMPERAFRDLRDYFDWMFGDGTAMQTIPLMASSEYKTCATAVQAEGDPNLLAFLRASSWPGRCLITGQHVTIEPSLRHLEYLQFSQFIDARIRFGFDVAPSLEAFHDAWQQPGGLEALFAAHCSHCYIEGRAAGANFPDAALFDEYGDDIAASCVISASAMQAGLLRNLAKAEEFINQWDWKLFRDLRGAAIRSALGAEVNGLKLVDFCRWVLNLAEEGLAPEERWMLAYPRHVCDTQMTGADRAIALWDNPRIHTMGQLAQRRSIELPQRQLVLPELDLVEASLAPRQLTFGAAPPTVSS
jgi:gamma-glutamylcysteine synthetase